MLALPLDAEAFKWPYSGMVHDLRTAISIQTNFLVALGLLVLTEVLGWTVLEAKKVTGKVTDAEAFRVFYEEYMARPTGTGKRVWGDFRGGLVHRHEFVGAAQSYVVMSPNADWIPPDSIEGVSVSPVGKIKRFEVNSYWRDWQRGLAKWAVERPDLMLADSPGAC